MGDGREPASTVTAAVVNAVERALNGGGDVARERLAELWAGLAPDDFFHRCVVAHYLADLQSEPRSELLWDQLALEAALAAPAEAFDGRIPDVTRDAFLPSLHLNLASSHERTLNLDLARRHAVLALQATACLPATPLAEMTRAAILRIAVRLGVPGDSR
jgi:hypothetical protein